MCSHMRFKWNFPLKQRSWGEYRLHLLKRWWIVATHRYAKGYQTIYITKRTTLAKYVPPSLLAFHKAWHTDIGTFYFYSTISRNTSIYKYNLAMSEMVQIWNETWKLHCSIWRAGSWYADTRWKRRHCFYTRGQIPRQWLNTIHEGAS